MFLFIKKFKELQYKYEMLHDVYVDACLKIAEKDIAILELEDKIESLEDAQKLNDYVIERKSSFYSNIQSKNFELQKQINELLESKKEE